MWFMIHRKKQKPIKMAFCRSIIESIELERESITYAFLTEKHMFLVLRKAYGLIIMTHIN